jgi:hypothetical protein
MKSAPKSIVSFTSLVNEVSILSLPLRQDLGSRQGGGRTPDLSEPQAERLPGLRNRMGSSTPFRHLDNSHLLNVFAGAVHTTDNAFENSQPLFPQPSQYLENSDKWL